MAMPGWGPVDDGPWIECLGCGATLYDNPDEPPICGECAALAAYDEEEGEEEECA